jgi:hydrogenase maturation protease
MTRALIAGIGNIFFGDDGFGVEVARGLATDPPPETIVRDFGIRGVHLAYQLLEPYELLVVIDCMSRGGTPGTLYVIEPELDGGYAPELDNAHGMSLPAVFASVQAMCGWLPCVRIVGCEPVSVGAGIGLSPEVVQAVPAAIQLVRELITEQLTPPPDFTSKETA